MDLESLIQSLTPEVYENLKNAVALGKWPNGVALKEGQRELCLEAIVHYEIAHEVPVEERVGYIAGKCSSKQGSDDEPKPITLQ